MAALGLVAPHSDPPKPSRPHVIPSRFLEDQPQEGAKYLLRVRHPFYLSGLDASPWLLYHPPVVAQNGWDDHPHEILRSALVRIRPLEILSSLVDSARVSDQGGAGATCWNAKGGLKDSS